MCVSRWLVLDWWNRAVGGYYRVDLPKLVEEIVVAPFAADRFVDLVRSLGERYGLGGRVRPSTLSHDPTFTLPYFVAQD